MQLVRDGLKAVRRSPTFI